MIIVSICIKHLIFSDHVTYMLKVYGHDLYVTSCDLNDRSCLTHDHRQEFYVRFKGPEESKSHPHHELYSSHTDI